MFRLAIIRRMIILP